jgi:homoserine dehydrogenase
MVIGRSQENMELELAFIGMGNVARGFATLLVEQRDRIEQRYGLTHKVTGIATRKHGSIIRTEGIDLREAVRLLESRASLTSIPGAVDVGDAAGLLEQSRADIVFENTPLNPTDGQPAIDYIRLALARGLSVVTANKGPVAFAYRELADLAGTRGLQFRFEGTVMDGTPVFNMAESCLPGTEVLGFSGVLNSTTNLILSGMESGLSFEACLAEAKRAGIAEENADYDLDGWDAAVKAVALARVLMGANIAPSQVARTGIRSLTVQDIKNAAQSGCVIRLVARGRRAGSGVSLSVAPESVPVASTLGSVRGTSNVLILETDLMSEIAIVETNPTVRQTAYALLADMISIHRHLLVSGGGAADRDRSAT